MAFGREVIEKVPWHSFSSVEDAEQHLHLILHGIKVRFVPEASVYGHMPATFRAAESQQTRWEAGRLSLLRAYWLKLLRAGLRGNTSALVTLIDLLLPPLSVIVTGQILITALALALLPRSAALISVISLGSVFAYIAAALPLARLRPHSYLALLQAPRFMLWKLQLYLRASIRRDEPAWTRTARDQ
jgi:cellulose synthase/poly-beta-1,6-N-acetylglucosamine synthase-like glycosyltransferase